MPKRKQPPAPPDPLAEWAQEAPALTDEEREIARRQLQIDRHRETSADLRRQVKFLRESLAIAEEKNELLIGLREPPPPVYRIAAPRSSRRNPAVSYTLASDWHVEEEVRAEWVNGKNEHNLTVAAEKVDAFTRNAVKLYKKEASHVTFHKHLAWWGGDFFTGHIHEDFKEITSLTPLEALRWLKPRIVGALRYWRQEMDCKTIVAIFSVGNHGRDSQRRQITKQAEHSYDWLLGLEVRDAFVDPKTGKVEDGFEFAVPASYNYIVDVGGFVCNFHHGHDVSFQSGVGGVMIPMNKYIGKMHRVLPSASHFVGHFHQELYTPFLTMNPSLIGYTPHSMAHGYEFDLPKQTFGMIDIERRCKSGTFPIYLTRAQP